MKPTAFLRSFLSIAGSAVLVAPLANGATYYWDNNAATGGFGTAGGSWATGASLWNTDTDGNPGPSGTVTTTTGDSVNFGNGATGLAAGTVAVNTVNSGNMTFASGSGAIVLSGGTITFAAASTITVDNASDTISSILDGAATSLTKAGKGTLNLTGDSSYTGATIINAGTLNLGGGTANGSLASTVLTLNGGGINYTRTGNTTQGFTTTNINAGVNSITVVSGNTLNLGTVARGTGGTLDFNNVGAGIVAALAANNDATGIMAGFTFGDSWAVANGAGFAISGLANGSYTLSSAVGTSAASYLNGNIDVDSSAGALDDAITANSLRFSAAAANTMTLTGTTNVITSGGILVGSGVGNNLSTITGGTLAGANTKDLLITQNNTLGGLTISSSIGNNTGATALVKSGAGLLTLSGSNTFTGGLVINAGTVALGNTGALFSTAGSENNVTFGSGSTGTLAMNGTSLVIRSLNSNANNTGTPIVENGNASPATLTIGNSGNAASTFNGVIRDGTGGGALTITKVGTGALNLGTSNTYTGGTNLNGTGPAIYLVPGMFGTGTITFGANNTLNTVYGAYYSFVNAVAVNPGVTATFSTGNQYHGYTFQGALTGSGTVELTNASNGVNGGSPKLGFTNSANTFSGTLIINTSGTVSVNSLGDSASAGTNPLRLGVGGGIELRSGTATSLAFTNRPVQLTGAAGTSTINNNSNNGSIISISQNLGYTTVTGNKILALGGSNGGNNVFAGILANPTSYTLSVTKNDSGKWTLSNDNSFTGTVLVNAGTLVLSGTNSYTGKTDVRGILEVNSLKNLNTNSSIGKNNVLQLGYYNNLPGTLRYVGGGDSTDRSIQINDYTNGTGNTASGIILNNGSGTLTFTASTFIPTNATVVANRSLELGGTYTGGSNVIEGTIQNINGTQGVISVVKQNDASTWALSGASNSYTGTTTISGGVLEASVLANGGSNSSIGASSNAATNLSLGNGATFRYIGSANVTTDRGFRVNGTAAGHGATIESSGSGTLSFDNTVAINWGTASQTRTLTLGGTNTGANTFGKVIANNTSATSLVKSGTGTWVLDQVNTYTGTTTVNLGKLEVSAGNINGTSSVTVNGGEFKYGSSTGLTKNVIVNSGGIFRYNSSVAYSGTLTLNSGGILGGGGTVGALFFGGGTFFDIFDAIGSNPLDSTTISFSSTGFGIDNLVYNGAEIDWTGIASGTYTLITGTLNSTNLDNFGVANAYILGDGRTAYFQEGSLQLVIVPEPGAALIGSLGLLALLRRRRN